MKKTIILVSLFLNSAFVSSQDSAKLDTIFKVNKEVILGKITSITEKDVIYLYSGETLTNTISKNQVKEIVFSNGRIQKISELIEIKGEEDWEKVQITNIESDISGLIKKGDVAGKANAFTALSSVNEMKEKAEMKVKKQAAALGAHIVFIKSYQSNQAQYGLNTAKANISGIAYGYK